LKTDITVVKASHLQPFISFLDKVGAPLDRLLNQVNLHADYFSDKDNLIAEAPFWSLLENASNSQGIEDLGFQVTEQLSLDSYGVFGAKVMQANSLYQALTTFIRDMGQQSNCPPFWLMEQGDFVWFCRLGTQGIKKGHWPIEQHVISLMIQLVRGFTSTTWTPPKVHLQTHTLKGADNTFSFRNSQIVINKAFTGICIPKSLLLNSAVIKPTGGIAVEIANQMTISTVNSHVIKELLMQSCVNQPLNAQQIAKSLGLNVRHMQRLLQKEGSSYRELSEQVLFKQSKIMLSTEQLSVLEVSLALGYSDAANFTRAFKRWSGLSPTQYKQLVN
jgi:AraC-like DNA-binding protein